MAMLIAGDIGGTKTDLAIFSSEAGPHAPLAQAKVHSADYPSLQAIVKEFLAKTKKPVDRACFAVAGPVIGGRVKTTHLPWVIEYASLARELSINLQSVRLINDLEAIARAVPILRPSDVHTINAGVPVPRGAIPVIAPGTGLGESFLVWVAVSGAQFRGRSFRFCSHRREADPLARIHAQEVRSRELRACVFRNRDPAYLWIPARRRGNSGGARSRPTRRLRG